MSEDDTLARALTDVSERRAALQAEYERIGAELAKVRQAENALRAIVENAPLPDPALDASPAVGRASRMEAPRASGRGSRGPRANSAKGRLRALLEGAGPLGLSHAQIVQRLPDVAPATLNAYLSTMVASGEAIRNGDVYRGGRSDQQERSGQNTDARSAEEDGGTEPADPGEEARAAE
ncbi:hypothetical protein [Methylobacterium nodulans]|uniref:Uncharacterized protein n=1 Tax=Methylobacterium nodulans (strain LMG 21967 / CNCM I-2342 / ORS 2060) TaxID=460265 RepID=B8IBY8_METNO|nr:hypothetical protein [Methylobacterium nodulans]ACL61170.1 conserved hypothetical protein [Methylobacterium nodulans ORS 2060]